MSKPIVLTFKWDEATFLEGAKTAYDYDMRHSWRRYVGWFFIALTQFGVVAALRYGSAGLLLLSTLLVLYWYGLRWPLRRRMLKRYFLREPDAGKTLEMQIDENGICIDTRCIAWDRFHHAIMAEKGYLLQMDETFLYIPRRVFDHAKTRNEFVALLREKIPLIHEFKPGKVPKK